LLLHQLKLGLRRDQRRGGVIEVELRAVIVFHERGFAIDVALFESHAGVYQLDRLIIELDVIDEIVVAGFGVVQFRARLRYRELEWHRVDLEQGIASRYRLAFLYRDLDDLAGDVRRDQNFLRADVSIIGRDVASALEIEYQSCDHHDQRQHHQ
jgi:hypothetical protein